MAMQTSIYLAGPLFAEAHRDWCRKVKAALEQAFPERLVTWPWELFDQEQVARFTGVELLLDDSGAWSLVGATEVLGAGAFTVQGSGWLDEETAHGELLLEGDEPAELVLDGLEEGCLPWSGGEEVCPW